MLGMLQMILGRHTITDDSGIPRHLQIFFQDLMGIAPYPDIRTAAVKGLIALAADPTIMLAAHAMWLSRTTPTATAVIVALFHHNVTLSFR
jgi:hypothetical protein